MDRRVTAHDQKVRKERMKPNPNEERIRHWESEIRAWKKERERLLRRLP
jgi:hypothetical protein